MEEKVREGIREKEVGREREVGREKEGGRWGEVERREGGKKM